MVASIILTAGKEPLTLRKDETLEEIPQVGVIIDEELRKDEVPGVSQGVGIENDISPPALSGGVVVPVVKQWYDKEPLSKEEVALLRRWREEGAKSWLSFAGGRSDEDELSAEEEESLAKIRKQVGLILDLEGGADEFATDAEFVSAVVSAGGGVLVKDNGSTRLVLRGAGKNTLKAIKGLNKYGKGLGREVQGAVVKAAVDRLTGNGAYGMGAMGKALKSAAKKEVEAQKKRAIASLNKGISGSGFYRGFGAYRGRGAYEHQYNQLFPGVTSDSAMHIAGANNETGNIVIRKREYLFDIFSPSVPANFTTNRFQANPGLGALGPFVSQIATNYEKYRYKQLVFTYKPTVTDSSSTGQMGAVLLAFNSNAGASDFVTKQQMAEYDGSMSVRVCDAATLGVECDPKKGAENWNFIRVGNVPTGQDIKTYDFGTFTVATSGLSSSAFPAGTLLGELWVEYSIELAGPKLYDGMGYSNLSDSFYGSVGVASAYPIGTNVFKSSVNSLGGRITLTSDTRYTLPDNFQGWIRITCFTSGDTAGTNFNLVPSGTKIVAFPTMLDTNSNNISSLNVNSVTGTYCMRTATYQVSFASSTGGNYFTLSATVTSGKVGWFLVEQLNSLLGYMGGVGTTFVPN